MITYLLNDEYNDEKFKEICEYLESLYPDYTKQELLTDVDYSLIQVYTKGEKKIIITNDADYDEITVRADIDLRNFKYTQAYLSDGEWLIAKRLN